MGKKPRYVINMKGLEYIKATREYLDYLEKHLNNIALAFEEVSMACDGMIWVGDDASWFGIREDIVQHDLSKFSKEEFVQYRQKFFPVEDEKVSNGDWENAWQHHQDSNPHHWQSIRYVEGLPGQTEHDIVGMVVDWTAMSYEFGGTVKSYYIKNRNSIYIEPEFRGFLWEVLDRVDKLNYKHDTCSNKEVLISRLKRCWNVLRGLDEKEVEK